MNWNVIFISLVGVIAFILIAMERAYVSNENSLPAYYEKYLRPISTTVILLLSLGFCTFFVYDIRKTLILLGNNFTFYNERQTGLAIGIVLTVMIIVITVVISLRLSKKMSCGQGIKNKYIFCVNSVSYTLCICTFFTFFTEDMMFNRLYRAVKWLVIFPLVLCVAYWMIKKRATQIKLK